MVKLIMSFMAAALMLGASAAPASGAADAVLGVWNTENDDARVEIYKCEDKYCGRIIWLKEPQYPAGSKEGTPGSPKTDNNNPEPALRPRPILGLPFMTGFIYAGNNEWKDGRLYDPEKGKTYKGRMTLESHTRLNLRGFIGISLIGRTSKWTRFIEKPSRIDISQTTEKS